MTDEERIRGLEDAVMNLNKIVRLRTGAYEIEQGQPEIRRMGEVIHRWIESVLAHREAE
jgi:hypothetical protein